jgi:hypothetical protein
MPDGRERWDDVEIGQVWRSRDKRDEGLTVTVIGFTQDHVHIMRLRRSKVAKRNWHSQYEPLTAGRRRRAAPERAFDRDKPVMHQDCPHGDGRTLTQNLEPAGPWYFNVGDQLTCSICSADD